MMLFLVIKNKCKQKNLNILNYYLHKTLICLFLSCIFFGNYLLPYFLMIIFSHVFDDFFSQVFFFW